MPLPTFLRRTVGCCSRDHVSNQRLWWLGRQYLQKLYYTFIEIPPHALHSPGKYFRTCCCVPFNGVVENCLIIVSVSCFADRRNSPQPLTIKFWISSSIGGEFATVGELIVKRHFTFSIIPFTSKIPTDPSRIKFCHSSIFSLILFKLNVNIEKHKRKIIT